MIQDGPSMVPRSSQDGPKNTYLLKEKPKRGNWVALGCFGLIWADLGCSGLLQAAMGCLRLPCATLRFSGLL